MCKLLSDLDWTNVGSCVVPTQPMGLLLRPDPPLAIATLEPDRARFGRLGRRMPQNGTRLPRPRLDDLTGLRNARALDEELAARTRLGSESVPLAIVVVDFDGLESVNARYDRSVGDAVLWAGAAVARDEAPSPRLVFRYGDDDLVVLVPGDDEDGREVAERIRERIAAENRDVPAVTVSCGVAAVGSAADAWEGIDRAEAALALAKRAAATEWRWSRTRTATARWRRWTPRSERPSHSRSRRCRSATPTPPTTPRRGHARRVHRPPPRPRKR